MWEGKEGTSRIISYFMLKLRMVKGKPATTAKKKAISEEDVPNTLGAVRLLVGAAGPAITAERMIIF